MSLQVQLMERRAELDTLRKRDALIASCGLAAYKPHYKQDLFHSSGHIRGRYVRTGNRFGKSLMGAAEDCAWALGYRPWYPEGDKRRYLGIPKRSVKILIVVLDWDKAEEIFTNEADGAEKGKLFKLLPQGAELACERNQAGKICRISVESKWGGLSSITLDTIQSYKRNNLAFESGDWDAIHYDEPCPEKLFKSANRGLIDRGGSYWFTCTPLLEPWINDHFLPPAETTTLHNDPYVYNIQHGNIQIKRWMIDGTTRDNPTLSEQSIAEFEASLSDEERETRLEGKPANLTGCIYKEFKREIHVRTVGPPYGWRDWLSPPADYTVRLAIDTHIVRPQTVLFVATSPQGYNFYYAEHFQKVLVQQLKENIWTILDYRQPARCLLELAAYNENPVDGIRLSDVLGSEPNALPIETATKDLSFGILRCKEELSRRDDNGNPFHIFSPFLTRTLYEFDRYRYDPETGKPVDEDDHMMECFYRLVLTGLDYVNPADLEHIQPPKQLAIERPSVFSLPSPRQLLAPVTVLPPKKPARYGGEAPKMRTEQFRNISTLISDYGRRHQ